MSWYTAYTESPWSLVVVHPERCPTMAIPPAMFGCWVLVIPLCLGIAKAPCGTNTRETACHSNAVAVRNRVPSTRGSWGRKTQEWQEQGTATSLWPSDLEYGTQTGQNKDFFLHYYSITYCMAFLFNSHHFMNSRCWWPRNKVRTVTKESSPGTTDDWYIDH